GGGCASPGLPPGDAATPARLRGALDRWQLPVVAAVPYRPELTWPRVRDLVRHLHPRILREGDMSRRIRDAAVFAAGIPGGLHALDTRRLGGVPGGPSARFQAGYLTQPRRSRL